STDVETAGACGGGRLGPEHAATQTRHANRASMTALTYERAHSFYPLLIAEKLTRHVSRVTTGHAPARRHPLARLQRALGRWRARLRLAAGRAGANTLARGASAPRGTARGCARLRSLARVERAQLAGAGAGPGTRRCGGDRAHRVCARARGLP